MSETVTMTYPSINAMRIAEEQLLGAGIPQEKYFLNEDKLEIKVITSKEGRPEIEELLQKTT